MKKILILSITLITLTVLGSCSVEELFEEEATDSERLVAESPYTFDSYELYLVDDKGESDFTDEEVEADMNRYLQGARFTFKENGEGSVFNPEDGDRPFSWSLSNGTLTTTTSASGETNTYPDFKVGNSEINFSGRIGTLHFRDSVSYTIIHTGNYIFK